MAVVLLLSVTQACEVERTTCGDADDSTARCAPDEPWWWPACDERFDACIAEALAARDAVGRFDADAAARRFAADQAACGDAWSACVEAAE